MQINVDGVALVNGVPTQTQIIFFLNQKPYGTHRNLSAADGIDSNGIRVDILWANEIKINVRSMSHHIEIRNMSTQHQQPQSYKTFSTLKL